MSTLDDWDAYERISFDPDNEHGGVGRQRDDNEHAVQSRGGRVVLHNVENDTSAWRKRRVQITDEYGEVRDTYRVIRPVWAEALRRLRSRESKRLMVWNLDRLARDPRDLEDAIEAVNHYGAVIVSADGIDLTTEHGQQWARQMVQHANMSSADTARRVKRQKEARLAAGAPPGSRYRTFGYDRSPGVKVGTKITGGEWSVNQAEAEIVREVFERVASGESINAVTKDLRARGVRTVSGVLWSYQAALRMLDSPIYCGWLSYKGERAHESGVEAIVSEDVFDAANARRERRPGRVRTRRGLLSGIALCDNCDTPMIAGTNNGREVYTCNRLAGGCGNVSIKRSWLDIPAHHYMTSVLTLSTPTSEEKVADDTDQRVAEIDREIMSVRGRLKDKSLDLEDGLDLLGALRSEQKALLQMRRELTIVEKLGQAFAAADQYVNADVTRQAAEVRRHIQAVRVKSAAVRGRVGFDASRFEVLMASGRTIPGPEFVAMVESEETDWAKSA